MNFLNESINVNFPSYNAVSGTSGTNRNNGAETSRGSAVDFSSILNESLKEQVMQSVMTRMQGVSGLSGGLGEFGGTNTMLGLTGGLNGINGISGFMPSSTGGIENTLLSAAGSGEMSGAQLMLYMLLMMMQSGNGNGGASDMAPIMQMLAGMLSKSNEDADAGRQNNMAVLGGRQGEATSGVRRMIDAALSQLGYHERNSDGSYGNGNISKFGEWYGMNGQPWCAMFVSWAAEQAGILGSVVPKHAYTPTGADAYKARGLYAPSESGYIPREGDAIYFYSERKGRIGHVGIVVAYDPETQKVYTVEGNTGNAVRIRHYDINNPRIHGYGRNGGEGFGTVPNSSTSGSVSSTLWD